MKHGLHKTVFPLLAALALVYTACPDPAGDDGTPFVAVTGITGVPASGTARIP
jgi:hypothetical protein